MSTKEITCIVDVRGEAAYAMRGTGFEPADPYGTAPSTLRRWPSLATHARCVCLHSIVDGGIIKGLSFGPATAGVRTDMTTGVQYANTFWEPC